MVANKKGQMNKNAQRGFIPLEMCKNLGNRLRLRNWSRASLNVFRKRTQPYYVKRNEQRNPSTYDGERIYPTNFRANPSYSVLIREKGFTILEAMIALVILSIALLALLRVMPVGIKGSKLAEETTIATMLAQRKIEEIRAAGYPDAATTNGTFAAPDNNFDWEMTVNSYITNLRDLSLSIYWPAASGSPGDRSGQRCVGIKTYMADYSK